MTTHTPLEITDDLLVSELWARDVRFLMGQKPNHPPIMEPAELIAALADSDEARLGMSLIPLFLQHPEYAAHVQTAAEKLSASARLLLKCYYTAAIWLEQKYLSPKDALPDLFSDELDLIISDHPDENLRALAKRHQELSGEKINWLGTYEHAADVWLKEMELQKG
jgi:hypothetical protein